MNDKSQAFPPPAADDRVPDTVAPPPPSTTPPAPRAALPSSPAGPPPAPPAKRESPFGRGFGLGLGLSLGLGVVGTALTVISGVFLVIFGLVVASAGAGPKVSTGTTTIWSSGAGTDVLRAFDITGAIMADASDGSVLSGGTYGYEVADQIDSLRPEDAGGVILLVNTPGGSIGGSKAIADAVERYQDRTGHKVFVHVSSMSASGGVYATSTADEIVADHGAMVGSIGVIFGPFERYDGVIATSGTLFEQGVTTTGGITSEYLTAGTGKDFGNPFRDMTKEEREHYTAMLQREYDAFVAQVSVNRNILARTIKDELGASLFDAVTAKEVGLVDEVMGREDFFWYAAEAAGLDAENTRIEATAAPSALESLLGVERASGQAPSVSQGAGVTPVLSRAVCGGAQPVAILGLKGVCG
ncbi:MAG: S49 family peptidase [Arachnia sp.]